jgi:hypothetical protein
MKNRLSINENKNAAELSAASIFCQGQRTSGRFKQSKFSHHSDGFTNLGFAPDGISLEQLDFLHYFF